jgi:hypothetical protein
VTRTVPKQFTSRIIPDDGPTAWTRRIQSGGARNCQMAREHLEASKPSAGDSILIADWTRPHRAKASFRSHSKPNVVPHRQSYVANCLVVHDNGIGAVLTAYHCMQLSVALHAPLAIHRADLPNGKLYGSPHPPRTSYPTIVPDLSLPRLNTATQ